MSVGTAVARMGAIAMVGVILAGCARDIAGEGRTGQYGPVERQACQVSLPAQWSPAIAGSRVDAAGTSTIPRAVSPTGEIVAVRDTGTARDLVLIGADKSVRDLHSLPEPNVYVVGDVGIDDRWIVFAVDRLPRNANGVLPQTTRIEVIDRQSGARRTVAEQSAVDAAAVPERNVLGSFVVSDGTVYWTTDDEYNGDTGAIHSFDPATGSRTQVASGLIRDIKAGPAGAAWSEPPVAMPPDVAALPAAERASLGTDGTAFGWIGDASGGRSTIGYWSPEMGVVRVAGVGVDPTEFADRVLVFDSFVVLDRAGWTTEEGSSATFVDTRSGAVAELTPRTPGQFDLVEASMGGTLALALGAEADRGPKEPAYRVGLLREGALTPLTC